jgi:RNA polymerase sigma-70 factor, ECF subfamily
VDEENLSNALAAARNGDEHGFAVLWRALQPGVLRYLRVVVGDVAQDVASETWLQVARDIREFRGDLTGFRVWLFRIARNRGLDELRRAGRRKEEVREMHGDDGAPVPDAVLEAMDRLDTAWALAQIATLPTDQAEAVMLRVVAGLDVAQTAAVLGKRSGAVRVAALRGLRRLARNPEVQARWSQRAPRSDRPVMGGESSRRKGV